MQVRWANRKMEKSNDIINIKYLFVVKRAWTLKFVSPDASPCNVFFFLQLILQVIQGNWALKIRREIFGIKEDDSVNSLVR